MDEEAGKRNDWNRDETILACELYFRTPYGQIHSRNPEIIELANLIGRTPGSVSSKLSNFASCDPEVKRQNKKGLGNAAKLTKEIFTEFSNNIEELVYQAQMICARLLNQGFIPVQTSDIEDIPPGEYRERVVKTRVGQYYFRMAILNDYRNRCCITGLKLPSLLTAGHIKPWRVSDERTERTNPHNGLCLNEFHHKAFDNGLFTIDTDYKIMISGKINDIEMDSETKAWLMRYGNRKILLPDKFLPGKEFIEYHNDEIFLG